MREYSKRWAANRVNMTDGQKRALERNKLRLKEIQDAKIYYANMMSAYQKVEELRNRLSEQSKKNKALAKRVKELTEKKEKKTADVKLITHLYHVVCEYMDQADIRTVRKRWKGKNEKNTEVRMLKRFYHLYRDEVEKRIGLK